MFATESLALVGENYSNSPYSKRACEFLISKQRSDGGWGESYKVRGSELAGKSVAHTLPFPVMRAGGLDRT